MLLIPDSWAYEAAGRWPSVRGLAEAALEGDDVAERGLIDFLQEEDVCVNPFKVGKKYLVCTVTMYYVGRVKAVGFGTVDLEEASWVHWTGRLSELCKTLDFRKLKSRKPRTEYIGDWSLLLSSIVGYKEGDWALPLESIQ